MLIRTKVIGIGQAGNKAAIMAVDKGVIRKEDCLLINTTSRDIPTEYKNDAIIFGDELNGCGKERDIAKTLFVEYTSTNEFFNIITNFFSEEEDDDIQNIAVVISSTEGGTGSGASIVLSDYINDKLETVTHIIGLLGFEDDPKGLENSINWLKEVNADDLSVHLIDNKKFLETSVTKQKAEIAANEEICNIINIISGSTIVESETKNIDSTDLFKIIRTPGYTIVTESDLKGIDSVDDFNSKMRNMVLKCKSLKSIPKCAISGIIINCKPQNIAKIDEKFKTVFDTFGNPYEKFYHYQDIGGEEYIQFIFAGMNMPKEEVQNIIKRYSSETSKVNFEEDNFTDTFSSFKVMKPKSSEKKNILSTLKRKRKPSITTEEL